MYKILLVDDEPEILDYLHDILAQHFAGTLDVTATSYSGEAMDIINAGKIDILITDIKMPEYTGFDLAEAARGTNSDIKIVFLTGHAHFDYAHNAIKMGCDDYILKTNAESEIAASIGKMLDVMADVRETDAPEISDTETMEYVKTYILEHLGEDLSLQKLSDAVYYNPSYLSRIFKQSTGEALSDFIINARIDKAKKLLRETRLKIYEVSQQAGFESVIYFNRMLKKKTEVSPKVYRQSQGMPNKFRK